VRARDVYCRNPICRRRAIDVELDHTRAFLTEGGTTSEANLYGGCVHHHRLKHHPGWTVTQDPGGRITWVTPTGHCYTSEPYDYRSEADLMPETTAAPTAQPAGGARSAPTPGLPVRPGRGRRRRRRATTVMRRWTSWGRT
jgi:hypothetical protein